MYPQSLIATYFSEFQNLMPFWLQFLFLLLLKLPGEDSWCSIVPRFEYVFTRVTADFGCTEPRNKPILGFLGANNPIQSPLWITHYFIFRLALEDVIGPVRRMRTRCSNSGKRIIRACSIQEASRSRPCLKLLPSLPSHPKRKGKKKKKLSWHCEAKKEYCVQAQLRIIHS